MKGSGGTAECGWSGGSAGVGDLEVDGVKEDIVLGVVDKEPGFSALSIAGGKRCILRDRRFKSILDRSDVVNQTPLAVGSKFVEGNVPLLVNSVGCGCGRIRPRGVEYVARLNRSSK